MNEMKKVFVIEDLLIPLEQECCHHQPRMVKERYTSVIVDLLKKPFLIGAYLILATSAQAVFGQSLDSQVSSPRLSLILSSPLKPLHLDLANKIQKAGVGKPMESSNEPSDWTDHYARLHPSVLRLFVLDGGSEQRRKVIGSGSAVAVDQKTLLSNCHILKDSAHQVLARDAKGKTYPVKLHAEDRATDRCVFRAKSMVFYPVSAIRSLSSVKVGEKVFAIGHPRGIDGVLTDGLIAAIRTKGERKILLTSASFTKGSSGGGLFDQAGNLLGITTGMMNDPQYLGVVIPADDYMD
jgi:S1-C subfamily serine protease